MKYELPGHVHARKNRHGEVTSYQGRINDPVRKTAGGNTFTHTRSFDTEAEAWAWVAEQGLALAKTGNIPVPSPGMTVAEACNVWLARILIEGDDKKGAVRAGTHRLYREHLERYIKRKGPEQKGKDKEEAKKKQEEVDRRWREALADVPDIGSLPIRPLTGAQEEEWLTADALEEWALHLSKLKGRGLAKRVLRDVKAVLARAAIKLSIPNIWRDVKLAKGRDEDSGVVIVLQTHQAKAIMDGALQLRERGFIVGRDGQPLFIAEERDLDERLKSSNAGTRRKAWARWAPLVWLLFGTGLRIGEGLALVWGDIDLKRNRVLVQRTVSDQGSAIETTKTVNGKRWIQLDADTMEVLGAFKRWCEAPRSKRDLNPRRRTDDDAFVFGTKGGDRWDNQQNFRRAWDVLLTMLGLVHADGKAWASPHDARHWHASFLFETEVPLADVSLRLGHSSTTITADIYIHALGDRTARDRQAADKFIAALRSTGVN